MSRAYNTLKRSDISTTPIKLKYSSNYEVDNFSNYGIQVNLANNSAITLNGVPNNYALNYRTIRQLYYQNYISSSLLGSSSYYDPNQQSTACRGCSEYENRYFPTASNSSKVTIIASSPKVFGEQISRNSVNISPNDGVAYKIIDDGNGNLINITGSIATNNTGYGTYGVRLYSSPYNLDGTGNYIAWNTANNGGTYAGTFWANPSLNTTDGRLNQTGLCIRDTSSYTEISLNFNITASSNTTYYFGIGEDNYSTIYFDNTAIISESPGNVYDKFRFWNIYPVTVSSGSHSVKMVVNNYDSGIESGNNPMALALEIYNNTYSQISQSIAASPMGTGTPNGMNIVYSSKDHVGDLQFKEHVGNVIYSQGLIIITNQFYSEIANPNVDICSKTWSKKNLDVIKYRNGEEIPLVTGNAAWTALTTGARCCPNNDCSDANIATYGYLYNWYAVNDSRGIAPLGYHVPTKAEFDTFFDCLGGSSVAGGKLKSTGTYEAGTGFFLAPNTGATNSTGFNAIPTGYRQQGTGTYQNWRVSTNWWIADELAPGSPYAWNYTVGYSSAEALFQANYEKTMGFSVRVIKD